MGMEIADKELRGLLAKTLTGIWKRVSWKDMTSMKRSSVDVFSERLRAAAGMENVPQMLEKDMQRVRATISNDGHDRH